ncbi:MAG: pullulanase X25 domain-containing protein, partial [Planctomycetota bacterium]
VLAELRKHFADKMFGTIVNFNTKIKEAASFGQPIGEYDSASRGQRDFRLLAQEVIDSEARQQRREIASSLTDQLESMSATADELLQVAKPAIEAVQAPMAQRPEPVGIEAKLSDYYGVNHVNDAVVFVTLYPRAESVQIAGDFNSWQPEETPMQKVDAGGVWQTKLSLPVGKYHYRLVVDGQWQQDPYNELTELNPFGEFNSVIEVK